MHLSELRAAQHAAFAAAIGLGAQYRMLASTRRGKMHLYPNTNPVAFDHSATRFVRSLCGAEDVTRHGLRMVTTQDVPVLERLCWRCLRSWK